VAYEIAKLPGAPGVATGIVSHLVALDPRLAEQYPGVTPAGQTGSTIGSRVIALRELIATVCEEAPVCLLLDDAHWLDDESRQILGAVIARMGHVRLLIALASRDVGALPPLGDTHLTLELPTLNPADVGALIASIGALPAEADWPGFLVARVMAASRGIPLLVLGALRELVTAGVLELSDGAWTTPDEPRLRERLRNINAVANRLRALSAQALDLLVACSIAGRPLSREHVNAIASQLGDPDSVLELDRSGHLKQVGSGIEVSHDVIAETAVEIAASESRDRARRILGSVLVHSDDEALVEHGIRHLAAVRDHELLREPLERMARSKLAKRRIAARDFVARLTGLGRNDDLVVQLARALPRALRWRRWRSLGAAGVVVIALGTSAFIAEERRRDHGGKPTIEILAAVGPLTARHARVSLDMTDWSSRAPLTASFGNASIDSVRRAARGAWWRPGAPSWAVQIQTDTGGADVAEILPNGQRRWIAQSHAEENPGAWSPDGRYFAVITSAFAKPPGSSIGIIDLKSRTMRPLRSVGRDPEHLAWSPDGTRIAYITNDTAKNARNVCQIGIDGLGATCRGGFPIGTQIDGWSDETSLVTQVGSPGSLVSYDPAAKTIEPLGIENVVASDVSPDGDWLYYSRQSSDGV